MKKIKKFAFRFYGIFNKYIFRRLFKKDLNAETFFQLIKHYFVGFISAVLNYLSFNLFMIAGFGIKVSNIIAYVFIIIVSFVLQKYFTYKVRKNSIWQPILFVINALVYYVLDTILLIVFIDNLLISPWISKIISIIILFPLSFLFQKYIVFRRFKVRNVK